jgi:hypothetical protein
MGILKKGHEMGDKIFNVLGLGADIFEEKGIDDEVDPKTGKGLCSMEDDVFIIGGDHSFLGGMVFGAIGVCRIKGADGNVVSVVIFIGSFATEFRHVFLGRVSDKGKGFSHGDPAHEEMALGVDVSCVSGAIGEVDAASEVAVIGAVGSARCFAEACFAKKSVAAFTDGMADLFFGAVKKREDFGGFPRVPSAVRFHAFERGKGGD